MSLEEKFQKAQLDVKKLPSQPNDVLLTMYALFKQATLGDATGKKPGMFDIVAKAKFEAWEGKKGLSKDAAMQEYIALVEKQTKQGS